MYGYIYKVTHKDSGRVYIGQKKGVFKITYYGSGTHIKRALKRYGVKNFSLEILETARSRRNLDRLERKHIREYRRQLGRKNMFNLCDGGKTSSGTVHSKAYCVRMSKLLSGKNHPRYGKHNTKEWRKNHSKFMMGENNPQFGKPGPMKGRFGRLNSMYGRCGKRAPMYGKKQPKEICKRISKAKTEYWKKWRKEHEAVL